MQNDQELNRIWLHPSCGIESIASSFLRSRDIRQLQIVCKSFRLCLESNAFWTTMCQRDFPFDLGPVNIPNPYPPATCQRHYFYLLREHYHKLLEKEQKGRVSLEDLTHRRLTRILVSTRWTTPPLTNFRWRYESRWDPSHFSQHSSRLARQLIHRLWCPGIDSSYPNTIVILPQVDPMASLDFSKFSALLDPLFQGITSLCRPLEFPTASSSSSSHLFVNLLNVRSSDQLDDMFSRHERCSRITRWAHASTRMYSTKSQFFRDFHTAVSSPRYPLFHVALRLRLVPQNATLSLLFLVVTQSTSSGVLRCLQTNGTLAQKEQIVLQLLPWATSRIVIVAFPHSSAQQLTMLRWLQSTTQKDAQRYPQSSSIIPLSISLMSS